MNQNQSNISICYNYVRNKITPEEICRFTHTSFIQFYVKAKNKKIDDKCLQFMLFRQKCMSYLNGEYFTAETDIDTLNALQDYFDCSLSVLFFKNRFGLTALNEIIDNEFYFALLPFVIDRVEFPSIFNAEISNSLNLNGRKKVKLQRRNFLANLLLCARNFTNEVTISLANHYSSAPTFVEINRAMNRNKSIYLKSVANVTAHYEKLMLRQKTKDNKFIVYRGYDIDSSENVLIDRKIRLQDANKSFSFTANTHVAEMFATYKISDLKQQESTTYDDRITLISSFVDDQISNNYRSRLNRKYILAKFELNEEDIIITPFSTSTSECEVFAMPYSAKLVRYSIVHSS